MDMTWLEKNIFDRTLDEEERDLLEKIAIVKTYKKGDLIIREGDTSSGLFILYSGKVSLQHENHGQAVRIATVESGAQLGDMALFNGDQASATAKALGDCEVYHLPKEAMDYLARHRKDLSNDIMLNTIRNLGSALRNMNGFTAYAQQYIQGQRV
jgi:CRP-like cAMP-binding protein